MTIGCENRYFANTSLYDRWLAERCVIEPGAVTPSADLFSDWEAFAKSEGEIVAGSAKAFGQFLAKIGHISKLARAGAVISRCHKGLRLVSQEKSS